VDRRVTDSPAKRDSTARLLDCVGGDSPGLARERLSALRRILLFGFAVECAEAIANRGETPHPVTIALATGAGLCALAAWREAWGRPASALTCLLIAVQLAWFFPTHANHQILMLICFGILAALDGPSEEEPVLAVQTLRWIVPIGLFWAGLQKLLYGYYFGGELLAYSIAETDRFASLFQWILSEQDFTLLRSDALWADGGPFRVDSPALLFVSNASYLGEITIGLLLLWRPTRIAAALAGIGLIVAIEAGAREMFFGSLMLNLLLLFLPANWNARALPGFMLLYTVLLATALGWLPHWEFT
jgi:hypothetical protein